MYNALISITDHTPYRALFRRQPALLPPLEGGYHGDLDATGQNKPARVMKIAAVAIIEATAKQRLARGDRGEMTVAQQ